jgi:hypothetical protein
MEESSTGRAERIGSVQPSTSGAGEFKRARYDDWLHWHHACGHAVGSRATSGLPGAVSRVPGILARPGTLPRPAVPVRDAQELLDGFDLSVGPVWAGRRSRAPTALLRPSMCTGQRLIDVEGGGSFRGHDRSARAIS